MFKGKVASSSLPFFPTGIFLAFILAAVISSCSTQKNTLATRTYHQLTARYNTYFNGRESFRSGVRRVERQFNYDYNKILPVFLYTDPDIARSVAPEMDRAINKASRVITRKSITARPKEGGGLSGNRGRDFHQQSEYNRWVRESYLLAGKAHFYKHDYFLAAQAFMFIIREYGMNEIRHEAKLWLARTYCERGRFNEARILFDEMNSDPRFPVELHAGLYSTTADFHLKQDQMEEAIVNLEKALEAGPDKERRIRYTYILAQLHERTGNYPEASGYYDRVTKMNPPYEIAFNARLGQAGVVTGDREETGRMINLLERMLRDDKNRDYTDQIYYAIGNVYMRAGDEENTVRMYTMSAAARGVNPSQKAITYLALANIYFGHPDYLNAQAYYDSVVMNMGQEFPERQAIIEKSNRLNELAGNIRLFMLEDSVQVLAAMSETERNRKIDEIIARVSEDEAEARRRELLEQQAGQFRATRPSHAVRQQAERAGGGSWYFYNPSAVTFGHNEFESLWGNRRLEDNWRRSDRQVLLQDQFAMAGVEDDDEENGADESADTRSREYYMRNIPLTEHAMRESHQRLQDALYNMAVIFNDDFRDYQRSAESYEELIRRYPEGEYLLPAYYDLHSMHLLSNNYQRAEHYKNLIVTNHPASPYAAILTNPDFFREYEQQLTEAERYYEETYDLFRSGNYQQVEQRALYASVQWPDSELIPRFEYLRALSWGAGGNIPLFREKLTDYMNIYPETEMADNAREFLAYLEEDYPEVVQREEVAVRPDIYEPGRTGVHHFVIIVDNRQELINRMVFNIVNFNVDYFPRLKLNISSHPFSTNFHLLRVDGLPDVQVSLEYLRRFSASPEVYAEAGRDDFPVFVISPDNYKLFMQDRNIGAYLNYFNEEYLKR